MLRTPLHRQLSKTSINKHNNRNCFGEKEGRGMKKVICRVIALILSGAMLIGCSHKISDNEPGLEKQDKTANLTSNQQSVSESQLTTPTPQPDNETDNTNFIRVEFEIDEYYTIKNKEGMYLSRVENSLTLSNTPYTWIVKQAPDNSVFIVDANDNNAMFDVCNNVFEEGISVGLFQWTGYEAQYWHFEKCGEDYVICSSGNDNLVLCNSNDGFVLSNKEADKDTILWNLEKVEVEGRVKSSNGKVTLMLDERIFSLLGEERIMKWANDLELACNSLYELTGYEPHKTAILTVNKKEDYWGYYLPYTNTIYFDLDSMYDDLKKMLQRENDWNFGALHELGHLYDDDAVYNFDDELLTDLKILYIIDVNGASAAPSEYNADTVFSTMDEMIACYTQGRNLEEGYDVFAGAGKFGLIAKQIGWEPFKQTFRNFPEMSSATRYERFEKFVELLGEYSNEDVRGMFTEGEWQSFKKEYE